MKVWRIPKINVIVILFQRPAMTISIPVIQTSHWHELFKSYRELPQFWHRKIILASYSINIIYQDCELYYAIMYNIWESDSLIGIELVVRACYWISQETDDDSCYWEVSTQLSTQWVDVNRRVAKSGVPKILDARCPSVVADLEIFIPKRYCHLINVTWVIVFVIKPLQVIFLSYTLTPVGFCVRRSFSMSLNVFFDKHKCI